MQPAGWAARFPRGNAFLPGLALLLLAAALGTHWPDRNGFFQVDDFLWLDLARWRSVAGAFIGNQGAHLAYRPIFRLSAYLDALLFGREAAGWHIENIVIQAANGLLLAVVLRSWRLSRSLCAAAALLFVVAPLSGESVDWISGRTSLLCVSFELLAVWRWTVAFQARRPPWSVPWAAAVWMLLAAMTYEAAVVLPVQLLCLVPLVPKVFGIGWRHAARQALILACVMVAFWLVRAALLGTFTGQTDPTDPHLLHNLGLQLWTLWAVSWKFAGPVALAWLALAWTAAVLLPRLFPAGLCLAAAAGLSLLPFIQVAGAGTRFFYSLQAPLCVLAILPCMAVPKGAQKPLLVLVLVVLLPRLAIPTWHEAAAWTTAGQATRRLVEAVHSAVPVGDGTANVLDGIPVSQDGHIMMGDYGELGLSQFYKPGPAPLLIRTRTMLYYPQFAKDVLAGKTRFWLYDGTIGRLGSMTREAWLQAHPEISRP